jgi:hypothetical protein
LTILRRTELARHDDRDRRKGLVDLDAVDITEFPPGAVERLTHRRDRSKAEQSRLNGGDAVGYEARCRVESPAFREILICQHYRSSPTVEAGRIAPVIVPSARKAGFSIASAVSVVSGRLR